MSGRVSAAAVSRALAKAGHRRSTTASTAIKGYRHRSEGFEAYQYDDERVVVSHRFDVWTLRKDTTAADRALAEYAETLRAAGYAVASDGPALGGVFVTKGGAA